MNLTEDSNTTLGCGLEFFPLDPTNISPGVYAAFVVKIVLHALTCPFTILLNGLVMIAVKTKRQLRTKPNIALACLATTDFLVGLVLQPLQLTTFIFVLQGAETVTVLCTVIDVAITVSVTCALASFYHLFVMSGERYLAIKHSFAYRSGLVTEARIIIASGLSWLAAVIIRLFGYISEASGQFTSTVTFVNLFIFIPAILYFHVSVFKEVRRNKKQIIANQVSSEARAKMVRDRKSFYTTTIVLLAIILCYIPVNICVVILAALKNKISAYIRHIILSLTTTFLLLNSLFNPLIYAVRIRYFRVAFIQLLSRKTLAQAEELEKRIFQPKRLRVAGTPEQEQTSASGRFEGPLTLDNGQTTQHSGRTQIRVENVEETVL